MEQYTRHVGMLPISLDIEQSMDNHWMGGEKNSIMFLGNRIRARIGTYDPVTNANHFIELDGPVVRHDIEQCFGPPIDIRHIMNLPASIVTIVETLLQRGIETLPDSDKEAGIEARDKLIKMLETGR